jgi:hypothetical protein
MMKAVSSAEPRVVREAMKAARGGEKAIDREWKGDVNLQKQYRGVRNLFTILLALGSTQDIEMREKAGRCVAIVAKGRARG